MKFLLIALFVAFSSDAFSGTNCQQHGDITSLTETWKSFRHASLQGKAEKISGFYKFPLKLLSSFDGDRPIAISKKVFLENYRLIFQENDQGEETELYQELKKTTGGEYIPRDEFDANGCAYPAHGAIRVEDYNFVWNEKNGWLIESAFYGSNYFILKPFIDKKFVKTSGNR